MEPDGALPLSWWTLLGIAIVAGIAWMFAVTWWLKPTLYATAASGVYSIAALSWWRGAMLRRRWLLLLSAVPLAIATGCTVALVMWGLGIAV
jgi:hypothetical protein